MLLRLKCLLQKKPFKKAENNFRRIPKHPMPLPEITKKILESEVCKDCTYLISLMKLRSNH